MLLYLVNLKCYMYKISGVFTEWGGGVGGFLPLKKKFLIQALKIN